MAVRSRMRCPQKVAGYSMGREKEQRKSQPVKGGWTDKYKEEEFAEISTKDATRKSSQPIRTRNPGWPRRMRLDI
jgi:hypothetical protein